jgi:hypothetical protein
LAFHAFAARRWCSSRFALALLVRHAFSALRRYSAYETLLISFPSILDNRAYCSYIRIIESEIKCLFYCSLTAQSAASAPFLKEIVGALMFDAEIFE